MASSIALLLSCALLVALTRADTDLCLDFSSAIAPVEAGVALGTDVLILGYTATDLGQTVSVFQYLEAVMAAQTSNYMRNIIIGFNNENTYQIQRCQYYLGSIGCSSPNSYIYLMRNDAIYGPSSPYYGRRVQYRSLDGVAAGLVASSSSYNTTQRPWYIYASTSGSGWAVAYPGATSGALLRSYVDITYYSQVGGAVWSSDRTYREPCAQCLQNVASFPIAVTLSNSLSGSVLQAPSTQRQTSSAILLATLKERNSFPAYAKQQQIYYGLSSGSFYMATDCEYSFSVACSFTSSRYLFAVADVINQYNLVYYDVDDDLVPIYDYVVYNRGPYSTTQRPWYLVTDGWSDPYLFASANVTARSYSASFQNGVAAADPHPNSITSSCDPIYPEDTSSGSGLFPLSSLLVLAVVAFFA